jgi:peptidoglycan hydrolase CwlO-like protein
MNKQIGVAALCIVMVLGCNNREKELEKQLGDTQSEKTNLQQNVAERDAYFEEVMRAVNEVYADLESARAKEALIKKGAGVDEGPAQFTNADARQKLLKSINDIGSVLQDNRQKIASLQKKVKGFNGQIASLNTLIENLKTSLQEREQSVAQLQARVQGLETTMAEKTKEIAQKEEKIDQQQKTINTGYYVIGTRAQLKEKGIIADEGGFLWGLLGSTTILASGIDGSEFTPIDKNQDLKIHVPGKIEEILPRRRQDFFAMANEPSGDGSELTIVSPEKFWQDRYLVIVVD